MQRRIDPWLVVGLATGLVLLGVAFYGDRIAPYEPIFLLVNGPPGTERPLPPGQPFLFGSDAYGRDLWSLVLVGARTTLAIVTLAGLARVALGFVLAILGSWSRSARLGFDALADLVSAVPSTVVAVLLVLVLAGQGAPTLVFAGALLITGWAGPYRLLRSELDRLRVSLFTEGARSLGVRRGELLLRHHLPHLVPVLALSASQQIAAALVALAELGVLGIFVGPTRAIVLGAAVRGVTGLNNGGLVSDVPEWGGLLAIGRGIQNLYVTRWAFLVPGAAIAGSAVGITILGVGIARHYRRGNLVHDLSGWRTPLVAGLLVLAIVPSFVLPDRHAAAVERGNAAREQLRIGADPEAILASAGLAGIAVDRETTALRQTGPARVMFDGPGGAVSLAEGRQNDYLPVLYGVASGGTLRAPVVFAGWGLSPADFPPAIRSPFAAADLGALISTWEDDYAKVDVRGKVLVLMRLPLLRAGRAAAQGPSPEQLLSKAIAHGPAAVLVIDGAFGQPAGFGVGSVDAYTRLGLDDPIASATGIPTFVLSGAAGDRVLAPIGVRPTEVFRAIAQGDVSFTAGRSLAQAVPGSATIELPVGPIHATSHSVAALSPARPDGHRLVLWVMTPSSVDGTRGASDALAALLRSIDPRASLGLAFVLFDPRGDPVANAKAVKAVLGPGSVDAVLVVDTLVGSRLTFQTTYGDLIPVIDDYATRSGAAFARTARTLDPDQPATGDLMRETGIGAFVDWHWLLIRASGPLRADTGMRDDAAAVLGYAVARFEANAPELVGR